MKKPRKYTPIDLSKVERYSIKKRSHKTHLKLFAKPASPKGAEEFLASLPQFLKASDLQEFVKLALASRRRGKPFHWLLGAHTIKVGLSPLLIDLMESNIITGLSFNCAGLIHDLELAFFGGTSEDVQKGLTDGSFGMVRETAGLFAEATAIASEENIGLGEAGGRLINRNKAIHRDLSVFAACERLGLPLTVHVGICTDTIAQHPEFDAAATAAASHIDFRILADICRDIDKGGTLANVGSAVLLPEVFLKALTVARNVSKNKSKLTTANFDMITHYRPTENVLRRPTFGAGIGFNFVGHHEIMIPLLAWALKSGSH
jgi:hypothetical protein